MLLSIGSKGGSSTEKEFASRAPALSASLGAAAKSDWPEIVCEGWISKGDDNSVTFEIRRGNSVWGDHVLALSVVTVATTSSVALILPGGLARRGDAGSCSQLSGDSSASSEFDGCGSAPSAGVEIAFAIGSGVCR